MTKFSYFLLCSVLIFSLAGKIPAQADKLLISEFVVTFTAAEYIEIYNPNQNSVNLSNYYLTDATYAPGGQFYYNIVIDTLYGGGNNSDFHARFPDGATIAAGEYQTMALNGTDFVTTYAVQPTYELWDTDGTIPDMREAVPGSINNQGTLTNGDEVIILYYWDGTTDLVGDVDYVIYDDAGTTPDEAVDKTGISIDGPDPGTDSTTYLDDTPLSSQTPTAAPVAGFSSQRIDLNEGAQVSTGGNGVTGADETSEDLNNTFVAGDAPTPNAPHPSAVAIGDEQNFLPTEYILHQNFPNPFNPRTVISYQLAAGGFTKLTIFDLLGQEVTNLVNRQQPAGYYEIHFDGSNLASGVYLYRLETGRGFEQTRKMILMK